MKLICLLAIAVLGVLVLALLAPRSTIRGTRIGEVGLNASKTRTRNLKAAGLLIAPGQGTEADVKRLAAAGRKIEAIKLYRELHQADLKSAKDAVDKLG